MADEDNANLYEYHKNELNEKLDSYNEKIKKVFEELTMKREESKILNAKINSLNEQINYYETNINLRTEGQANNFTETPETDTVEKLADDNDQLLVYQTLKKRLDEISRGLLEVESIPEKKTIYNDEPIHFQCVCVLFVPDLLSANNVKYQAFRITHETKVQNIIESSLALWDQSEKEASSRLFFYENETWKQLNTNDNVNNLFKGNKNQIKRAKFLLTIDDYKPNNDDLNQEENQNKALIVNKDVNNDKFFEYTKNFVGLARYVQEKYAKLKQRDNKQEKEEKKPLSMYVYFFYGIQLLFHLLFFIFLILSNVDMMNPSKSFLEIRQLSKIFTISDSFSQYFDNDKAIIDHMVLIFDKFYVDNIQKKTPSQEFFPYKMINMARFSFYPAEKKECDPTFKTKFSNKECYEPKYTINELNDPYEADLSDYYENLNNFELDYYSSQYLNNKGEVGLIPTKEEYKDYIKEYFLGFYSDNIKVEETSIQGKYGTYKGKNCVDIFASINYINFQILRTVLEIMTDRKNLNNNDKRFNFFSTTTQKAIVITFALENFNTQKYYYVSLLYEFSATGGRLYPVVDVYPFYPNLTVVPHGKLILITDIFRLIFALYFIIFCIYKVYDIYNHHNSNFANMFAKILTLETISDLGIFIIEVTAFSLKFQDLYNNPDDDYKVQTIKAQYYRLPAKEYFPVVNAYQLVMMLEGFLMLFVLLRFLCYGAYNARIKNFFRFIRSSFIKGSPYLVVILVLVLIFSIFANNLWGERQEMFSSYPSAFFFTFDFSFGLFQSIFEANNSYEGFEVIFIFFFIGLVIFFFQSSLFGIYLESYRLNSLQKGNNYNMRLSKKLTGEEKPILKKDEERI